MKFLQKFFNSGNKNQSAPSTNTQEINNETADKAISLSDAQNVVYTNTTSIEMVDGQVTKIQENQSLAIWGD